MLLNSHQKQQFKELYPVTSMPNLMKIYGTNNRDIIAMARLLGVYQTKIGKDKVMPY